MSKTLFVVFGAGASFASSNNGSVPEAGAWLRPPLTPQLFDPRFNRLLAAYPLLHNAVPEIVNAMQIDPAASLEEFLRTSYRDSPDPLHKRIYREIPRYLQELLYRVSNEWTERPDRYALLVHEALRRFDEVIFVTLNYDTLLDSILHPIGGLNHLDDFIRINARKRFALVKLHGSITWRARLDNENDDTVELGDEIQHGWGDLSEIRLWREDGYVGQGYPILSVPLGSEDDLSCPSEHAEFLIDQLQSARDDLKMMIIGYSGLDQALIRLLVESTSPIRNLIVVDRGRQAAGEVIVRLKEQLEIQDAEPSIETFDNFGLTGGQGGLLQRWSE